MIRFIQLFAEGSFMNFYPSITKKGSISKPRYEWGMKNDFFYTQVFEEKDKSVLAVQFSLRYLDI